MKIKIILNVFLCLFLAGCSTIMKEEWEEVYIESTPAGAQVQVDNGQSCHTPCHLELDRGKAYKLTLQKDGYEEHSYDLNGKSLDGWLWGNTVFLIGLPIAVAIDFYTGYAYDFSPSEILVDLKKK
jgi:uncharacterized protein YceK